MDFGQVLIERLILFSFPAFVDSIDTLFYAVDRKHLNGQVVMWEDLSEVNQLAENVDRLKFLGTFSLAQKISTRTIISLDPLATNAWFYDSQSMAVR